MQNEWTDNQQDRIETPEIYPHTYENILPNTAGIEYQRGK